MSQTLDVGIKPAGDERLAQRSLLSRLMARPEIGALVGAIVIWSFFFVMAEPFREVSALSTVLYASSTIGIPAVAVALLMIGGEFDLSAGVAVTSAALIASMFSYQMTANVWVGVAVSLAVMLGIGFLNGYLVVTTGIPSFLVTLGSFFMLTGLNLAATKIITGNVATSSISDMDGFKSASAVFASEFSVAGVSTRITLLWWLFFVAVATWALLRTHVGNWIFAIGGEAPSARAVGVPVKRVKIALFMTVSLAAWFAGMHLLFAFNTVQSGEGVGKEFLYIIAAVVGGCLLTGGYGSAVGAAIGAVIFGMTSQGIVYAGWNPDWFKFFLGAMLLGAVLLNTYVRRRAEENPGLAEVLPGIEAPAPRAADEHVPSPARVPKELSSTLDAKMAVPLIRLTDAEKRYGNIIALSGVSLEVSDGEVTCVLGDNGAGKSTLIKIISGLHQPDGGTYEVEGQTVRFSSPREALERGIATVYQDLAVCPLMPVWRNFFLGNEVRKGVGPITRMDIDFMRKTTKKELLDMGIDLRDVAQPIGTLSGGERQCVAISRAVFFGAKVLILDEPTASLGVKQSGVVLRYIVQARERGLGVIFITHNPHHAYPVGDRFLLLKRGRTLGYYAKSEITRDALTALMAGGAELEQLSRELERGGGAASAAAHVLQKDLQELGIPH